MKKYFSLVLFASIFLFVDLNAQRKGDVIVGANTSLNGRIVDLSLAPTVGYQLSDNVQLGFGMVLNKTPNTSYDWYQLYGRYYPTKGMFAKIRPFAQAQFGVSSTNSYSTAGLQVGLTSFIKFDGWFFVEPSLGWTYSDYGGNSNSVGVNLALGLRL